MTLAIGHRQDDVVVIDAVRERRPPFSPDDVVAEFSALMKSYRVSKVSGDRYAGEWPRERFRDRDIGYEPAEKPKSDLYRDLLPLINAKRLDLIDDKRLQAQLCGFERRTSRAGKDSIDHMPGSHDDVANAWRAAPVLLAASGYLHDMSGSATIRCPRCIANLPYFARLGGMFHGPDDADAVAWTTTIDEDEQRAYDPRYSGQRVIADKDGRVRGAD